MSDQRDDLPQHDLHDMGGNIGPASIRGSSEPEGSGSDADSSAPKEGYAESGDPVSGSDDQFQERSGAVFGGDSAPPPVAGAPNEYVSIDDADNLGRGGDGDTQALIEQKHAGGPQPG
jgi:hypothetical protein